MNDMFTYTSKIIYLYVVFLFALLKNVLTDVFTVYMVIRL